MPRSFLELFSNIRAQRGMGRVICPGSLPKFTGDLKLAWAWLRRGLPLGLKAESSPPHSFPLLFCSLPHQASSVHRLSVRHTVRQVDGMGNSLKCDGEKVKQKALGDVQPRNTLKEYNPLKEYFRRWKDGNLEFCDEHQPSLAYVLERKGQTVDSFLHRNY